MVSDTLRIAGNLITAVFLTPFIVANIVLGRWSRANHYGKALEQEFIAIGQGLYRLTIGHPGRLLGLTSLTHGIEHRIPEAIARAPAPDLPRGGSDAFEGYRVVGSLPSGGSGARLFLAEPRPEKREQLENTGHAIPGKVVIKSFSLSDGSTMPQIVRESRALEAARKLGLVLEHDLAATRFHYVMPYVPGEDLTLVTQRLHDKAGSEGLGPREVALTMNYIDNLLQTMQRFHTAGLWHKDIKPSNIIVSDERVHLVDLGLITPLRSAMTLTTHGTEYFRDPELVRLALRGVKVQEVDGVKFDIYGAGAVLFSVLENGFPAHGSLSQIRKRCPEALRWIVRRAMADMNNRYGSATEMMADIRTVMSSPDPFQVAPADLPSLSGDPSMLETLASEESNATAPHPFPRASHTSPPRQRDRDPVAASSRQGRVRRGALVALVLFGVCFVIAISIVGTYRSVLSATPPVSPSNSVALGTERAAARFAGQSRKATALGKHRTEPKKVLVIDDLGPSLRNKQSANVEHLFETLKLAHFDIVGQERNSDVFPNAETALESEARVLIGLSTEWNGEMHEHLEALMRQTAPPVSAVLFLAQGDEPGQFVSQCATLNSIDRDDLTSLLDFAVASSYLDDTFRGEPVVAQPERGWWSGQWNLWGEDGAISEESAIHIQMHGR
jgi:serine/threonine protein kinase